MVFLSLGLFIFGFYMWSKCCLEITLKAVLCYYSFIFSLFFEFFVHQCATSGSDLNPIRPCMVKMWETSAKFSNIYVEQLTESSHIGLMSSDLQLKVARDLDGTTVRCMQYSMQIPHARECHAASSEL